MVTTKKFALLLIAGITTSIPAIALAATTYDFSDFADFHSGSLYSIRGLALSSDDSNLYLGFIHPTSGTTEAFSTSSPPLGTNPTPIASSTNATGGQPKGVATDDRGYIYATENTSSNSNTQKIVIFDSSLDYHNFYHEATITFPAGVTGQLSGISEQTVGGIHYVYASSNKGNGLGSYIVRYNVQDPTHPTLDTSFGTNGFLNIKTMTSNAGAFVNGIEVATDGTIYAAGGTLASGTGDNTYGDSVFKIMPNANSSAFTYTTTSVAGAMDVALVNNGDLYVTQYASNDSNLVALNQSNLQLDSNVTFNIPTNLLHNNSAADSGFSGIDVAADGTVYFADEIYQPASSGQYDRILVSTPTGFQSQSVPTPAAMPAGLALLSGLGFFGAIQRRRRTA